MPLHLTLAFVFLTLTCAFATTLNYGTVIGIDLGTTYSCVGVYHGGRVDIVPNDQGNRITPSWVGFSGGERLIGDTAKQSAHARPSQTIFDVKRLLGRCYDSELYEDIRHWPFKVVNNYGRPAVEVLVQGREKIFTPQEISAMILGRPKETAEAYLGQPVTHAVITVPAYFNDEQRQATKDAGQIAGLTVLRIINEPTAAAIAYGLDKKDRESKIIVYDLGGGTFDVSLLRVNHGVFEVLATAGDTRLGGEDFDNRVMDYLIAKYERETGTAVAKNKRAMSKLKREVEKAKRTLSSQLTVRLDIESFEGGNDFSLALTRAKFEELNLELFQKALLPVTRVLRDANIDAKDIDEVVLVGGSTRIPKVRKLLKDFFNGKEPRMGINPDEAVAHGAAIQGSILSGSELSESLVLVDVCPFTLGIETSGGVFSRLIPRNSPIPFKKSETFSTATNNQRTVLIQVFQGENELTKDNTLLGTFKLGGIPPSARGVPQIDVTFDVDADGILTVVAHNKDSGNSESITIMREDTQIEQTDLARMVHEAQEFSQRDQEFHEHAAKLNELQQYISSQRTYLNTQSDRAGSFKLYALLDEYSEWIESLGPSATLSELETQALGVRQAVVQLGADTNNLEENGIISGQVARPDDLPSGAVHQEL